MLLTLILNLDMAGGAVYVPPSPYTPGGGGYIRRRYEEPETHDEDIIPFIKSFLEHCVNLSDPAGRN